jgi:hypothetical protein
VCEGVGWGVLRQWWDLGSDGQTGVLVQCSRALMVVIVSCSKSGDYARFLVCVGRYRMWINVG